MTQNSRRSFLRNTVASAVAVSSLSSFTLLHNNKKQDVKINTGIAGYTFRHFDVDQSLQMMERVGVKFLSVKNFHLPYD